MGEIKVLLQTNDNLCESDVFIFALFIKAFRELYKDETYKFYMSEALMTNLVNFDVVNNQDFMLEKELLEPANITLSQGSIILPNKKFDKLSEISLNLESDTLTGVAIRSGNPIKQSSYFLRLRSVAAGSQAPRPAQLSGHSRRRDRVLLARSRGALREVPCLLPSGTQSP